MDWNITQKSAVPVVESTRNSRLVSAAHQFEASMMNELMKPLMENSLFEAEDANSLAGHESGGSNALMGFASEAFARSLSDHGGLGIARQIIDRLRDRPDGPGFQMKKES
jgi:flagellar protein FlgJ